MGLWDVLRPGTRRRSQGFSESRRVNFPAGQYRARTPAPVNSQSERQTMVRGKVRVERRLAQWRLNKGLRGSAQRGFIDPAPDFTGEQTSRVITRLPVKGPARRIRSQRVTRKILRSELGDITFIRRQSVPLCAL